MLGIPTHKERTELYGDKDVNDTIPLKTKSQLVEELKHIYKRIGPYDCSNATIEKISEGKISFHLDSNELEIVESKYVFGSEVVEEGRRAYVNIKKPKHSYTVQMSIEEVLVCLEKELGTVYSSIEARQAFRIRFLGFGRTLGCGLAAWKEKPHNWNTFKDDFKTLKLVIKDWLKSARAFIKSNNPDNDEDADFNDDNI